MRKYCSLLVALFIVLLPGAGHSQCGDCEYPAQLVVNGSFTQGNTGFSTDLNPGSGFFCPLCPEGTYVVGSNAFFFHNGFTGTDHTNPPVGNFFIANSPGSPYSEVWCQTMAVQPDTEYTFTFWGRDVTNNSNPHPLAWLHASFNGVFVGDSLVCAGGWQSLTTTWNSGSATVLDLCIVNTQWQTGGNDFGLDDISLTACQAYTLNQTAQLGGDLFLCGSESVAGIGMTALSGYQYSWNPAAGLSATNIANPSYTLPNAGPDPVTETLVLSVDSAGVGCTTTDTLVVTVWPMPPFTLGPDLILCPGETALLNAGAGWDQILWQDGTSGPIWLADATVSVTASVTLGPCDASDAVQVNAVALPELSLPETVELCEGQQAGLNAVSGGQWNTGWTGAQLMTGTAGTYIFTYSIDGCSTSDSTEIIVNPYPAFTISGPIAICEGQPAVLTADIPVNWTTGEWGTSITISASGYYGGVASNAGCETLEGIEVAAIPLPEVELPADTTFCDSQPVEVGTIPLEGFTYLWSTGETTSIIHVDAPGTYELEVSNACGSASAMVVADVYPCDWGIYAPTCVTPNGDPHNEIWQVYSWNVSNLVITVFNRLGEAVFHTTRMESWQPGPGVGDDTYSWLIEAIDSQGRPIRSTGFVAVLR
ncbi:MAG: gliding motility-associated C-terminal domain-containing protein [Flavobacteriales bacterium]